jgi:hypothetical protein
MTHHKDAKTLLRIWFFTTLLLVILGYSGFEARKILAGPNLKITSPVVHGIMTNPYVQVAGIAKNIKEIKMNGKAIYIDEQGNFNEKFLLVSGYNIIELEAKDKFNKETKKVIEMTYQG